MSADIMISYRREDFAYAGWLTDRLRSYFGHERVFIDRDGVRAGTKFPELIAAAIRDCQVVVALITPTWTEDLVKPDDWVRREMRETLELDRPIVPVLLSGSMLDRAVLPDEIAALADIEALVVADDDFEDDVAGLITTIENLIREPPPSGPFPDVTETGRNDARALWESPLLPADAQTAILGALRTQEVQVSGREEEVILLAGGDKVKARLLGLVTGPLLRLPLKGRLRISDRGGSSLIEVQLEEDFTTGLLPKLDRRYKERFQNVIEALRQASGRN